MPAKVHKRAKKRVVFYKKVNFLPLILVILFILVSLLYIIYNPKLKRDPLNFPKNTAQLTTQTPTPTKVLISPTPTPTIIPTVIEKPLVSISGPLINDQGSYVDFTYTLELNQAANSAYEKLFYSINVDGCEQSQIFQTPTRFSGELSRTNSPYRSFTVSINSSWLKSKVETRTDPFYISYMGNTVLQGQIGVPRCKGISSGGEYEIKGPGINKELVDGKYHFSYGFYWDSSIEDELKEGYTVTMYLDCAEYMDKDKVEHTRTSKNALATGGGYVINVDKDAFKGNDLTKEGFFSVVNPDGDLIYSGTYKTPNCR